MSRIFPAAFFFSLLTVMSATLEFFPVAARCYGQDSDAVFATEEAAAGNPDFRVQGEYVTPEADANRKGIQVVACGNDTFRIVVFNGGLPGAGWDRKQPQVLEDEDSGGVQDLITQFKADRVNRSSPTLGAEPPSGAMVLFDGTEETLQQHWEAGAKRTPNDTLAAGAMTKDRFRDYSLHLEFRTPFQPGAVGQKRGNSGVSHLGRYETQILDSFGLEGKDTEAGAIYEVRAPDLNLCFPPLAWQTYDVDVTAPRFDAGGKKLSNARLTVRLNGVVIQRDVEVPEPTRAAPFQESPEEGPIVLQDHGDAVTFRNIWILARDAEQESRRPRIPGYERFLALSDRPQEGGLILLGELGCINCHASSDELRSEVLTKHAPVLTKVGDRVNPDWLVKFIADPHQMKPGTTMPSLFAGWDESKKSEAVLALASFLTANSKFSTAPPEGRHASKGSKLFHSIGCVACHAPRNGKSVPEATSVSLEGIEKKYSAAALTEFLKAPHVVRPSGRMPTFQLTPEEAQQIAHFLLQPDLGELPPNVHYKVYHGSWQELPDFDSMTPVEEGDCIGFDLSKAGRDENFGMRFEGYLPRMKSLTAEFALGSDDGARLFTDGVLAIENDGIHPFLVHQKTVRLADVQMHHVRIDYFELSGEEDLSVTISVLGSPPQDLGMMLQPSPTKEASERNQEQKSASPLVKIDPALVQKGREFFSSLGCANCHDYELEKGKKLASQLNAKPLREANFAAGCLSENPEASVTKPIPQYDLTAGQRRDLTLIGAIQKTNLNSSPQNRIDRTLISFNCYACHERQGQGGPEAARNEFFDCIDHEMGDEGRLPPILTGVGDKLQDRWLKTVLDKGAKNRPYMFTRMPSFGGRNVGHLAEDFVSLDRRTESTPATFDEPLQRVKATGRQLVGNGGLACIKCHNFGEYKGTGIQAVSLTEITSRIREDWFLRYLIDPVKYRPGTRMPTGFPNGQAVVRDVYHGDANKQLTAIWTFLEDGNKAGIPEGMVASLIELIPTTEPIIFRNFFEESSPRGIAVGYPEKVNLIWDANELCLRRVWHDRFLDASMHWSARGAGNQTPLGDHIVQMESAIPLAQLANPDSPWPTQSPRLQPGYRFKGYSLNEKGEPTFKYQTPFATVADFPEPVPGSAHEGTLRRRLTLQADPSVKGLYCRVATGKTIKKSNDGYQVDGLMTFRLQGGGTPLIRTSAEKMELIVPLPVPADGKVEFVEEMLW